MSNSNSSFRILVCSKQNIEQTEEKTTVKMFSTATLFRRIVQRKTDVLEKSEVGEQLGTTVYIDNMLLSRNDRSR